METDSDQTEYDHTRMKECRRDFGSGLWQYLDRLIMINQPVHLSSSASDRSPAQGDIEMWLETGSLAGELTGELHACTTRLVVTFYK